MEAFCKNSFKGFEIKYFRKKDPPLMFKMVRNIPLSSIFPSLEAAAHMSLIKGCPQKFHKTHRETCDGVSF